MDYLKYLSKLKDKFNNGENIIQLLKNSDEYDCNSLESIMISYDFQAGSYINHYKSNRDYTDKYTSCLANLIEKYSVSFESIMEVGVGEATTLGNVLRFLKNVPKEIYIMLPKIQTTG